MDSAAVCPGCQRPLPADAPQGLCPECLIRGVLDSGLGSSVRRPFVAPTVDEIAQAFPQLEVLEFIGRGGMGAVYKVRQKQLDRIVALKVLPPGIGEDAAFAKRFAREARAMARLSHAGIVTIHDFGQTGDLFYFLMEFVDGVTLRQLLGAGRVSPREALAIVPQICDALQYAHAAGIVHRDIKPENVLLDRQGRVKVADFGLAKLVGIETEPVAEAAAAASGLTEAGRVMGTPQYMAPEQREHPQKVDHRADIYSLGVVFYQMLTGELPSGRIEPPSKRAAIDVRLDEVVLRALEQQPERRYSQASELKTQVENIAMSTVPSVAIPVHERPANWGKSVAIGSLVLLAAVAGLSALWMGGPSSVSQTSLQEAGTSPAAANRGTAADTSNLLLNPGMEEGDKSPAHWSEGSWPAGIAIQGVGYLWDRKSSHTGKASLRLHKTANRFFPVAHWRQVVPRPEGSSKLKVSAWVKAERVSKGIVDVQLTSDGGMLPHQWIAYIGARKAGDPPVSHDWKEYTGVVAIPPGTTQLGVALQIYGPGEIWLDDVRAELVPDETPTSELR